MLLYIEATPGFGLPLWSPSFLWFLPGFGLPQFLTILQLNISKDMQGILLFIVIGVVSYLTWRKDRGKDYIWFASLY
jgi:hypothetical protein